MIYKTNLNFILNHKLFLNKDIVAIYFKDEINKILFNVINLRIRKSVIGEWI